MQRVVADRKIHLTQVDPIERLKELCKCGKYSYKFSWDKFTNAIMMELELYYLSKRTKKTVKREVRCINTTDISRAKSILAGILMDNIILLDEEEEEDILDSCQGLMKDMIKTITKITKDGVSTGVTDTSDEVEK